MNGAKKMPRTYAVRGSYGFLCSFRSGCRKYPYRQGRQCASKNSPLKFRFDVADAVKLAVLIPKEIELQLLALLDALQVFDVLGEDG